ncbi:MAG: 1-aminocyclopropane-1-carboxylate deaminase/D-cysteine desulfhydrase [Candidatus Marinarcus sp.]|uniref:1-aminocyclopropane-1-carboxylate deaminase/D-cysteine desulfhydrase n=1 Tax=Candidatus Marinarcus sp. TaxID=3100987 RepID=UPI003AFFCA1D
MNYINSPIHKTKFNDHLLFVKRDDLLDTKFSGNKARKFYYYLVHEFPKVKKLISYGSPQANSLYSFSQLAKIKNWEFDFYVDHIASYLIKNPEGNYFYASENGANIIDLSSSKTSLSPNEYIKRIVLDNEEETLFVQEGGREKEAEFGVKILANEIMSWANENKLTNLVVVLPSGTGTTALFLQKNLPFKVITCACVGGESYLKSQFLSLEKDESLHPTIVQHRKKYHFGKLYREFYEMHIKVYEQTNIEFDLLYDPLGFLSLEKYLEENRDDQTYLYIHQGGLLGNKSMLKRYKRKQYH